MVLWFGNQYIVCVQFSSATRLQASKNGISDLLFSVLIVGYFELGSDVDICCKLYDFACRDSNDMRLYEVKLSYSP